MNNSIPFNSLTITDQNIQAEIEEAVLRVVRSGNYILGEELDAFENEFADYIGVKYCIGVGNGLDALKISLRVLGVGRGDEVLVPANTYIATLLAVSEVGAIPVLVEPRLSDGLMDVDLIEGKISPKTKAIIPVHLYGKPCDMDEILKISTTYNLYVIEDNAQAIGAAYQQHKTGSFGHLNAHSFYPTKNLGAMGDGGAITTNDSELAHKAKLYRNYGSGVKYHNSVLGYNSRLDEMQAGILRVKLKYLDIWNEERRRLASAYTEGLKGLPGITLLEGENKDNLHVSHLFVIRVQKRKALKEYLLSHGISTAIHYPVPPYQQKAYEGVFDKKAFSETDILSEEVLSLPLYNGLTIQEVARVVSVIRSFFR